MKPPGLRATTSYDQGPSPLAPKAFLCPFLRSISVILLLAVNLVLGGCEVSPTLKGPQEILTPHLQQPPPDVAATELAAIKKQVADLNDQTVSLFKQQKYEEALENAQQANAIAEARLGNAYPHTATSLNNLGTVNSKLGNFVAAQTQLQRAIFMNKQIWGDDHKNTQQARSNLAGLYKKIDRETRGLSENRSTDLNTAFLHVKVLNDQADELYKQRKYDEALINANKAISLITPELRTDSIEAARAYNNVGLVYYELEQYSEAEINFHEAYLIYKELLGPQHEFTITVVSNLGRLYLATGYEAWAEPLLLRALDLREKFLSKNHQKIVYSLYNVGLLYESKRDFTHARLYLQRALEISDNSLGSQHQYTNIIRASLKRIKKKVDARSPFNTPGTLMDETGRAYKFSPRGAWYDIDKQGTYKFIEDEGLCSMTQASYKKCMIERGWQPVGKARETN